ncbi:type II toxin-antitoxin system PemK/MazF family toxin [Streptomyces sp. NBC_01803]|uniref:type II toxin-antitoxin system PemK/MazF family toxin n=1 Tax=Streptomyces sp. NBC_01803 TaxID=2975946 RepID=UPI003FA3A908
MSSRSRRNTRPRRCCNDEEASRRANTARRKQAGVDISGLGVEVVVGAMEGLPFEGVLRFAFPRPGFTPCTWLTTVSRDDLIERAGALSSAKLSEIEDALRLGEQEKEWTRATTAKLSEIRDALRLGGLA